MSWTVIAIIVGIVTSVATYIQALRQFETIKGPLRNLIIATGILYVTLAGAGIYIYRENDQTQGALCALRTDLEVRTESGEKFLKEHPKGIPGISPKTIREGLHNQERSIKALGSLSC